MAISLVDLFISARTRFHTSNGTHCWNAVMQREEFVGRWFIRRFYDSRPITIMFHDPALTSPLASRLLDENSIRGDKTQIET